MPAPDNIRQLVERFDQHREAYRSRKYNETQLRREFLDPFFEALGWYVFNKQSYAELYKRSPRMPQEKESVQREIETTDGRIDRLVYELYGLSEEEIKIVEGEESKTGAQEHHHVYRFTFSCLGNWIVVFSGENADSGWHCWQRPVEFSFESLWRWSGSLDS